MKKLISISLALFTIAMFACMPKSSNQSQSTGVDAQKILATAKGVFLPLPDNANNPDNALTPEKIALGKVLYYDNKLSVHNTQSCNTCHNLKTYGVDNKPTSEGDNGKPGVRNSPTTLNAALHFVQFWDGRMKDVEEQAGGPVMNPAEMSMPDEKTVVSRLAGDANYKTMFAAAFPEAKSPVTFDNMKKAIGAFERTLLTPSKFDKFIAGDATALNEQELKGLDAFVTVGCTTCHMGALLGGNMFQKYPLFGTHKELTGSDVDDKGKMEATKQEADKYFFKVPSLRNVAETWPYMHDGSVKDLNKMIEVMAKAELNKTVTPEQEQDIVAFLKTLTGTVPASALQ